jgi:hypothetical protein
MTANPFGPSDICHATRISHLVTFIPPPSPTRTLTSSVICYFTFVNDTQNVAVMLANRITHVLIYILLYKMFS